MLLSKIVHDRLRQKYQYQFYAHFANYINELLYQHIHTQNRIVTKDLLHFIDDREYLREGFSLSPQLLAEIVATSSYHFQDPTTLKTEMPLMILTDTKDVFERRIKRFKKYINGDSSTSQSSSSISSITSVVSQTTINYLKDHLSQISISEFSNTTPSSSFFEDSVYNTFKIDSSQQKSSNQSHSCSTIKSQQSKIPFNINQITQAEIHHLILQYSFCSSSEQKSQRMLEVSSTRKQSLRQDSIQDDYNDRGGLSKQIKSVLAAQMKKYNLGNLGQPPKSLTSFSNISSSILNRSKRKMRQKAQQLLRHLGGFQINFEV